MAQIALNVDRKIILNTGNILSINDITKKPAQNTTEELVEALNFTIKEYLSNTNGPTNSQSHDNQYMVVTRPDDIIAKIAENDISNLKIGLKIFLDTDNQQFLSEAIDNAITRLEVPFIYDVIISFKHQQSEDQRDDLYQIKNVWTTLEKYVESGKIKEIGIADVEENTLRALFEWAKVKPRIIQINLATCCVVPPSLQEFCKEREVKLLTHSDPSDVLPKEKIEDIFGKPLTLEWMLRVTIHIKCRGVLITKSYMLSLSRNN